MKHGLKNNYICSKVEYMRKFYLFTASLFFMFTGCSSDPIVQPVIPENYVYLSVNDTKVFSTDDQENLFVLTPAYIYFDVIFVNIHYGKVGYIWNDLNLYISKEGKLIKAELQSRTAEMDVRYNNYKNFPLNYFAISDFEMDEATSRIKFKLDGKLYLDSNNLNSESVNLKGEFNTIYEKNLGVIRSYFFDNYSGLPQYCNAKINDELWTARFEATYGVFTSSDPYKFEIYFDQNVIPGSYDFNTGSTAAFIKFAKFNTTTLVFDYYEVEGIVSHSYREFHGANRYSFVGTYSFTATNPNNPSDVIQVTDGNFTSFQQY